MFCVAVRVHVYLSAAKARELLAWSPRFDHEESLHHTFAWYREFSSDTKILRGHLTATNSLYCGLQFILDIDTLPAVVICQSVGCHLQPT